MQATVIYLMVLALQGGAMGANNPCSPGVQVASECYDIGYQGCCTNQSSVRWCQDGVLCELSCATKPACGWKSGAGVYDCAAIPKGDPSCENPYSCLVDGCAPAYEQKGCCDCPCEDCVCSKDPYCCTVSWDPICVESCRECGGCGSSDGCTPSNTPGCAGCACQECVCALDAFCCTNKWDSLCAAMCADDCGGGCEVCQPDCGGKQCGPDGCNGICGICPDGYECDADGECDKVCVPSCAGRECGLDSCGLASCGKCGDDELCNKFQKCVPKPCEPSCDGKECGSDGCTGSCGECDEDVPCVDGKCTPGACMPECAGKQCGDDGCGSVCGYCDPGTQCIDGKCTKYCKPQCLGKQCGSDGCGGVCGTCAAGLSCVEDGVGGTMCKAACFPYCDFKECGPDYCAGTCGECPAEKPACSELLGYVCVEEVNCVPNCMGKECGDDGCGGSCGQCPGDWFCQTGMCVPSCTPQCLVPPQFLAYKQCGWDECPGQGVCGVCPEGHYCGQGYICVEDKCSCDGKQCGVPGDGCPTCGDCAEGETCDLETFQCMACQPKCITDEGQAMQCGDDGCGGSCGDCPAGYSCDETVDDGDPASFSCEPCVPSCVNGFGQVKMCGDDGCGGSCGNCAPGKQCSDENGEGTCVDCVAQCQHPLEADTMMQCGPSACPAGCMDVGLGECTKQSDCGDGQQCNAITGQCVACGSCGSCPAGWICDVETEKDPEIYICEICTPDCTGKECGDNGCGGMCGICPAGWECEEGICIKECNPTQGCFGKECGPNGCPHGCMEQGTEECGPLSTCPEGLICDPNSNMCVPCNLECLGGCDEGEYCAPGYICLEKPDLCAENDWECGDDGTGTSCGECTGGFVCVEHECVPDGDGGTGNETVIQPEVVSEVDSGPPECPEGMIWDGTQCKTPTVECGPNEELVDGQCVPKTTNECPEGASLVNGVCQCDKEGYKIFFGKCVKDDEEVSSDDGGCACTTVHARRPFTAWPAWALFSLFGLGLYMTLRRRRGQA